jgi:hypothetical protein
MRPPMTGRQRMNAVLRKQATDRLPWTTLVDNATLSRLPPELRGNGGIDFYRHLGCDIFLLNGWNTPHAFQSPEFRWPDDVETVSREEKGRVIREWRSPRGTLVGISERGHPVKYPVDSIEAVSIYRQMWEGATFAVRDDLAVLRSVDALIGNDGVVTRFWGPSTIPLLLENDMGVTSFYYLLFDHPAEMEGLIRTIHERELDAFRCLANGPWDSVTLVENTSTYYISPDVYERFNMPHQRDFVEIVRSRGKAALLHMCGHVRGILPLIRETGCDGIHALTPPPTGNTPWENALDVLGEDLIIFGCLVPSVFLSGDVRNIGPSLDALVTPRLRDAHFVLAPFADGIPVEAERFYAVKRWVEAGRA